MTGERIDLPQARQLLRQAVDTQGPDFIYNDQPNKGLPCINVPFTDELYPGHGWQTRVGPDSPRRKTGCLVGTALKLAGVPVEIRPGAGVGGFVEHLTYAAVEYFRRAQYEQDRGKTWGQAFAYAEEYAANVTPYPAAGVLS